MEIKRSVGSGGVNDRKDAYLVQILLNVWRNSKSLPEILEDGKVGAQTIAAIEMFQKTTGWVDGRVDPDGRAFRALIDHAKPKLTEAMAFIALGISTTFTGSLGYDYESGFSLPVSEANLLTICSFRQKAKGNG